VLATIWTEPGVSEEKRHHLRLRGALGSPRRQLVSLGAELPRDDIPRGLALDRLGNQERSRESRWQASASGHQEVRDCGSPASCSA